jgi:UPF0755 protein
MPYSARRILRQLIRTAVLAIAALAAYGAWYAVSPLAVDNVPAVFEIPPGSSLRATAHLMETAGVHVRPRHFELLARLTGRAGDIKAGNYELGEANSPVELLDKLTRGAVTQAEVRIIEGWTFAQLRAALDSSPVLRHDSAGLKDAEVLARVGAERVHPEGLFFPDTYLFARGSSDLAVLRRAYRAMQRHLAEEWSQRTTDIPYKSPYEALIMASIVEKETGRADEREQIAGVLVNRLRIGMALQVDPTVIYGLGASFDGNLKRVHLNTDGPYNTYQRPGLPPTPIALPGRAALRAAMRPAQTKALYYVSRGDGSSQFSRNLEEHNRAVSKYQLQPRKR